MFYILLGLSQALCFMFISSSVSDLVALYHGYQLFYILKVAHTSMI